jgi:hypothetical protein
MQDIKNHILTHIFLFLSLIIASSCNRQPASLNFELPSLNYDYLQLSNVLEKAYEKNSQVMLDTFFTAWKELLPAYSSKETGAHSDTVYEAYKVFQEYYSPVNLSRLTGGQHENFETDFRYLIVQNRLEIAVADTNPLYYYYLGVTVQETSIEDFRPKINIPGIPVVFLSSQADSIIFFFLFNPDSSYRADHQKRLEFLKKAVQLTHHHWIGDYHKITMPNASSIILNESFSEAVVDFRIFYQFGEAYLERKNGNWKLINSRLTAIE